MCTSPIRVLNKSHYHSPKATRLYITVPCGHCSECIAQKRAEWSLRSAVEYEHCVKNGGYAFFETLTFRPDAMPRFRGFECFDRSTIQYYLKRIRKRIQKDFGITSGAFRYFYVTEYGHKHKHPHFHLIFFMPDSTVPYIKLKQYSREEWKHGFTDLTSVKFPYRGVVQTRFCCEYVAKYVSKPDDYVMQHYEELKHQISKEEFRKYFYPFHQQSTGFGESLLFDPKNLEHFKDFFCVFNRRKFNLPLYYIRRLYYKLETNPDGSQSWRENDLGLQFVPQYKYRLYEDYTEDLCSFVDAIPQFLRIPKVLSDVRSFLVENVPQHDELRSFDFDSIESLSSFFGRYDRDFLSRFAYWKRFEQGYIIYDNSFHPLNDLIANEKVKSYFNCCDGDSKSLLVSLDLVTDPENLFFDSLLNVVRMSIGDLDKILSNLKESSKRRLTYFNYGN